MLNLPLCRKKAMYSLISCSLAQPTCRIMQARCLHCEPVADNGQQNGFVAQRSARTDSGEILSSMPHTRGS